MWDGPSLCLSLSLSLPEYQGCLDKEAKLQVRHHSAVHLFWENTWKFVCVWTVYICVGYFISRWLSLLSDACSQQVSMFINAPLCRSSLEIPEINAMTVNPTVSTQTLFRFIKYLTVLRQVLYLIISLSRSQENSLVIGGGDNNIHIMDLESGIFKVWEKFISSIVSQDSAMGCWTFI